MTWVDILSNDVRMLPDIADSIFCDAVRSSSPPPEPLSAKGFIIASVL